MDLQLEQDMQFQRFWWKVERAAWIVAGVILIIAILGLLGGSGLVNEASAGEKSDAMWMEYKPFIRAEAPTQLKIFLNPDDVSGPTVTLWISREYLDKVQIQSMMPEPELSRLAGDRVLFTFNTAALEEKATIRIDFKADTFGALKGKVGLENQVSHTFTQTVYP